MNTKEIASCLLSNPYLQNSVVGVFAADNIPRHLPLGKGCVVNTDFSNSDGLHWCAVFKPNHQRIEFFDSFGHEPSFFHQFWERVLLAQCQYLDYCSHPVQSETTNVCSQHCLFYLYLRARNVAYIDIMKNIYTRNRCFNDDVVVDYVSNICNKDLRVELSEPVLSCKTMKSVLESM
jgi:hypothetical protein